MQPSKTNYKGFVIISFLRDDGVREAKVYEPGAASRSGAIYVGSLNAAMQWIDKKLEH